MKKAVFGLANNQNHAETIIENLQDAGFSEISVLFADTEGFTKGFAPERGKKSGPLTHEKHTKAPEGGVTGSLAGGVIGGSLGLLAGLGALAIPGLGPFIAAGPIMAALSGSAIGGSLGLLVGALVGMGIPEYEAKKFENNLKQGNVLICVHVENSERLDQAKDIMKKAGAKDVSSTREKAGTSK